MTQLNFGTSFVLRETANVTRQQGFQPDWFYNQTQRLDNVCVDIESALGALTDHRPAVYICPILRTTNPTGLLYLQRAHMRAFPGQRVAFTRSSLSLSGLDPQGGANRRDLGVAVWILKPFTSAVIKFYTF